MRLLHTSCSFPASHLICPPSAHHHRHNPPRGIGRFVLLGLALGGGLLERLALHAGSSRSLRHGLVGIRLTCSLRETLPYFSLLIRTCVSFFIFFLVPRSCVRDAAGSTRESQGRRDGGRRRVGCGRDVQACGAGHRGARAVSQECLYILLNFRYQSWVPGSEERGRRRAFDPRSSEASQLVSRGSELVRSVWLPVLEAWNESME